LGFVGEGKFSSLVTGIPAGSRELKHLASIQSCFDISRAMENPNNFDAVRKRSVEDQNLVEPRNENEPAALQLGILLANHRSALGELREALESGVTLMNEPGPLSLSAFGIEILSEVELIGACGWPDEDRLHSGLLFLAP
jgi:hypothetical protein